MVCVRKLRLSFSNVQVYLLKDCENSLTMADRRNIKLLLRSSFLDGVAVLLGWGVAK